MTSAFDLGKRAEALCKVIAPLDLAHVPVYVLPQSALPAHFRLADDCDGYTTPSLDLYLQGTIGAAWRGRGPAMVINDYAAAECEFPEDAELVFMLTVLHELAHIVLRPSVYRERAEVSPERLHFESLVLAQQVDEPQPAAPSLPPFLGHEAPFIRTCIHVSYRAARRGLAVCPSGLCAGGRYGLSPAMNYERALGDEPARCIDASFASILAAPAPEAFTRIWNQDAVSWFEQCPSDRKEPV